MLCLIDVTLTARALHGATFPAQIQPGPLQENQTRAEQFFFRKKNITQVQPVIVLYCIVLYCIVLYCITFAGSSTISLTSAQWAGGRI